MNELRISKVERRIEVGSPQTEDHKDKMETSESKQKTLFHDQSELRVKGDLHFILACNSLRLPLAKFYHQRS